MIEAWQCRQAPLCWPLRHPLGHLLVVQHVGVPAGFAVVDTEGVTRVEPAEPGMLFELAGGHGARTAVLRVRRVHGAAVIVELVRPVGAPGNRVRGYLVHFHQADKRRASLLAMLENRHQQRRDAECRQRHGDSSNSRQKEQVSTPLGRAVGLAPLRSGGRRLV